MSLQVAFLTGQSDPGRCAISPLQQGFLKAVGVRSEEVVEQNFPFEATTRPWRETPLWLASIANVRQVMAARRRGFGERYRPVVDALLERRACTLLLTGSCGLELWRRVAPSPALRTRAVLVAYGPVAGGCAPEVTMVAQGQHDWISRLGYTGQVDVRCDCGHMGYLNASPLLKAVSSLVTCLRSRSS